MRTTVLKMLVFCMIVTLLVPTMSFAKAEYTLKFGHLANEENVPLVSSDWRLVEVAQELGLTALMNSAFLLMLLEDVSEDEDKNYLQYLYEKIIADEIRHSVNVQAKYDPVIRIQKIMDSAMSVVRAFSFRCNGRSSIRALARFVVVPI